MTADRLMRNCFVRSRNQYGRNTALPFASG